MKLALALLLVIRPWDHPCPPVDEPPETPAEFEIRQETIATADAEVAQDVGAHPFGVVIIAAGVAVVWHSESRFDFYIHAGLPNPNPDHHEDHGRARCMGSLHENAKLTHDKWIDLAGTSLEATKRCAMATALALGSSAYTCARGMGTTELAMAWTLEHYARGHCHEPSAESWRRARRWMRVSHRVEKLMREGHG